MTDLHPQTPTGATPATGHALGRTDMHPANGHWGPAAHTWTPACAGHHPVSGPCPSSVTGYGPNADAVRAEVDADSAKDTEIKRLQVQLANTQGHRERLNRELASSAREQNSLTAELDDVTRDRDSLRGLIAEILEEVDNSDETVIKWLRRAGLGPS